MSHNQADCHHHDDGEQDPQAGILTGIPLVVGFPLWLALIALSLRFARHRYWRPSIHEAFDKVNDIVEREVAGDQKKHDQDERGDRLNIIANHSHHPIEIPA